MIPSTVDAEYEGMSNKVIRTRVVKQRPATEKATMYICWSAGVPKRFDRYEVERQQGTGNSSERDERGIDAPPIRNEAVENNANRTHAAG